MEGNEVSCEGILPSEIAKFFELGSGTKVQNCCNDLLLLLKGGSQGSRSVFGVS